MKQKVGPSLKNWICNIVIGAYITAYYSCDIIIRDEPSFEPISRFDPATYKYIVIISNQWILERCPEEILVQNAIEMLQC